MRARLPSCYPVVLRCAVCSSHPPRLPSSHHSPTPPNVSTNPPSTINHPTVHGPHCLLRPAMHHPHAHHPPINQGPHRSAMEPRGALGLGGHHSLPTDRLSSLVRESQGDPGGSSKPTSQKRRQKAGPAATLNCTRNSLVRVPPASRR